MTTASQETHPITPRFLIALALLTILLRVGVFACACKFGHVTLKQYTSKGDTVSYIAYASAMSGGRSFASMEEYDRRVFPGYPALIAAFHQTRIPLPIAALLVTWIASGIAVWAAGELFNDYRIAWAMVCLVPHYVINSSLGMSEAPLVATVLLGLLLARREHFFRAGLVLGFAGLIRPMACFAVAGALLELLLQKRWKPTTLLAVTTALTVGVGMMLLQLWTGDALQGTRVYANHPDAYAGHLLLLPFQSLIMTPFKEPTSIGRIAWIWLHVVITLTACIIVTRTVLTRRTADPRDAVSFPWLVGNTLFVLCIGSAWGFRHFPRFIIPAEPAMFWTLRKYLPSRTFVWIPIVAAIFIYATMGAIQSP